MTTRKARHAHDDYPTDPAAIEVLVDLLQRRYPHHGLSGPVLEPTAGAGNLLHMLQVEAYTTPAICTAVEVQAKYHRKLTEVADEVACPEDFRWWQPTRPGIRLIVGNPPFNLAAPIVRKCYDLLASGGLLIFLLRLGFLESQERSEWNRAYPPTGICTLSRRPSFTGDGGSDNAAYAWIAWVKGPADCWIEVA